MTKNAYNDAPISVAALEHEDTTPMHLRPGAKQRRVVCAANRVMLPLLPSGVREAIYIIIGPRHFDPTMQREINAYVGWGYGTRAQWRVSEQGFIDQWGTFMNRKEAFTVAQAAGQILYGPHLLDGELDSSDLY